MVLLTSKRHLLHNYLSHYPITISWNAARTSVLMLHRQQPRMNLYQSVHSSIVGPRFFHHSVRRPQIRDEDIPFHLISIASSGASVRASARVCRWNWKCSWLTLFVVVCMLHVKKRSALPSVFQPDSRPPRPLPRAPSSLSPNGLSYYCCLSLDQLTHSEMMDM